ncbi:hypothetical protein MCOR02_011352 [Pyricularia oryzae]|nr:hypothetical protein MCOR02_011352 [Pyricularia oryzae]
MNKNVLTDPEVNLPLGARTQLDRLLAVNMVCQDDTMWGRLSLSYQIVGAEGPAAELQKYLVKMLKLSAQKPDCSLCCGRSLGVTLLGGIRPITSFPAQGLRNPSRFVTGHNAAGESVFVRSDHGEHHAVMLDGAGAQNILYSCASNPVQVNEDADLAYAAAHPPPLHLPRGAVVRMIDFAPGSESNMHRAVCLGIGTVCEGEVELSLGGSGESRVMRPGDVSINRGAMHRWRNISADKPARMLYVLLDVEPIVVNGKTLEFEMGRLMQEYSEYKEGEGDNKKV